MTTSAAIPSLSPAQHDRLRQIVHERTGVRLCVHDRDETALRLMARLEHLDLDTFEQYATFLTVGPFQREEMDELFSALGVDESSFFHDADQLRSLEQRVLPALLAAAAPVRRLRIWCAGCGTGQEAYTLAMIIRRILGPRAQGWHIDVLGTDISDKALDAAARAQYPALEAQAVPDPYSPFVQAQGDTCAVDPSIAEQVSFESHHLGDRLGAKRFAHWDLIVCRRVLPLFDDALQARVVGMFNDQLSEGGVLLLGRGELIRAASTLMEPLTPDGALGFTKPGHAQRLTLKAA